MDMLMELNYFMIHFERFYLMSSYTLFMVVHNIYVHSNHAFHDRFETSRI